MLIRFRLEICVYKILVSLVERLYLSSPSLKNLNLSTIYLQGGHGYKKCPIFASNTISSNQSTGVVTRSMVTATATTVTKRIVAVSSLYFTSGTNSNMYDIISRTLFVNPLNGISTPKLKMKHHSPFF